MMSGMAAARRRCAQCRRPLAATARADARYCSPACRAQAHRQIGRQARAGTVRLEQRLGGDIAAHCLFCGMLMLPYIYDRHGRIIGLRRPDRVYCSPACRTAMWRQRRRMRADYRHHPNGS
jgi:predicted nucleic acid-binding Zn ribbon protein